MFVNFGENFVEIQQLPTKNELLQRLSRCHNSLLLGEDAEQKLEFYLATVHFQSTETEPFCIGICAEGHGLKPHLLIQPELQLILFGYNQEVVGVNIENQEVAFRIKLNSLFYYFLPLKKQGIVLIVQEVDVIAIAEDGKELWRYGKDIITHAAVEGEKLHLNFMDEESACLNLLNGELAIA